MSIGFGHLASTLHAMHPGTEAKVIEARVRYFHRNDFPTERVAVGTGWRAEYGAVDMMKLACAFEFLALFVPPVQIQNAFIEGWAVIEDTLRSAWAERGSRTTALLIAMSVSDLGNMTDRRRARRTALSTDAGEGAATAHQAMAATIAPIVATDLRDWLRGRGDVRRLLMFDAARMVRALDAALATPRSGQDERMRGALDAWAEGGAG